MAERIVQALDGRLPIATACWVVLSQFPGDVVLQPLDPHRGRFPDPLAGRSVRAPWRAHPLLSAHFAICRRPQASPCRHIATRQKAGFAKTIKDIRFSPCDIAASMSATGD